jgi:hypothetical protein
MGQIKTNFSGKNRRLHVWLIIVITFFYISNSSATDYYFSNSGNDENSGTSLASPWRSVAKMQSVINGLKPGDRILLERGSVWHEVALNINNLNGTLGMPIKFEAYGEGESPILSGGKLISEFSKSGNIYSASVESSFPRGPIRVPTELLINGVTKDIARSDEFFTKGSNSWTQLTDANQNWTANEHVGSVIIYQGVMWSWSASTITGNNSNTVYFGKVQYYLSGSKWIPYYIANNDKYLLSDGDWTFKNNTLKIYSESDLNAKKVEFAISDSVIGINNSSNLVFKDIALTMANYRLLSSVGGNNILIDHCEFSHSGGSGIKNYKTKDIKIVNSYVHDIAAMGIFMDQCTPVVQYNLFRNIASKKIGLSNYTFRFGAAVSNLTPSGQNSYIEYNYFDSVGLAIQSHTFVSGRTGSYSYNYIENYGLTISDCAAIYCASDWDATKKTVKNNIIKNAVTSGFRFTKYGNQAINPHPSLHPHALYVDEAGFGYHCDSNSIQDASFAFYTNRSFSNSFKYNNVVNGNLNNPDRYNAVYIKDQAIGPKTFSADRDEMKFNNIVLDDNVSSRVCIRHTSEYVADAPDANKFYFDENKIASPFHDVSKIAGYIYNWGASTTDYSLTQLRNNTDNFNTNSSDLKTKIDPQGIKYATVSGKVDKDEFIKFFTNFSKSTRNVNLGNAKFKDMNGNDVSGSVTVPPFYSLVLFYASGDINTVDSEAYVDSSMVPFLKTVYANNNSGGGFQGTAPINSSFEIAESIFPEDLIVGTLSTANIPSGSDYSFSILSGNENNIFEVNSEGEIVFTTSEISFDGNPTYELNISAIETGSEQLLQEYSVTISLLTDVSSVNHAPVINTQNFETNYDVELPASIGTILASDPDEDQSISYQIIGGNEESLFYIESTTGELIINELPESMIPTQYKLMVEVSDNAAENLQSIAEIFVDIQASNNTIYIDPENTEDTQRDGSIDHPFISWSEVIWIDGAWYLQKRGTIATEEKILIQANHVNLSDYGFGDKPKIKSKAIDYAIKVIEKNHINISNLEILAENAIGCVYFLGTSCENNAVVNCELNGADYGLRIIDGKSYVVKYNVFEAKVDGIYSIADYAEIYYNVFKGNHTAVNLSSYSSNAVLYNNVFYNNRQGISASYAEISLFNNIFYLTSAGDRAINHELDKLVSNHNIYYPEQTGFIQIANLEYNKLNEIQDKLGLDMNSLTQDPMFVDTYNDNFGIENYSKAVDAGKLVGLEKDFVGQKVPTGLAPDIGLIEISNPTAVEKNIIDDNSRLKISPNPTKGIFYISVNNHLGNATEISVYSSAGHRVSTENVYKSGTFTKRFDLTDLSPGIYYVTVKSDQGLLTSKVIKD